MFNSMYNKNIRYKKTWAPWRRCPVRKVTAKGGGAAIPARPRLLGRLVAAAVAGAGGRAPVTVKMRTGISDGIQTYLEVCRVLCGATTCSLPFCQDST